MMSNQTSIITFNLPLHWPPNCGELWKFDSDILLIQSYDHENGDLTVFSEGKVHILRSVMVHAILSSDVKVKRICKSKVVL
jgi:hypothetical protein